MRNTELDLYVGAGGWVRADVSAGKQRLGRSWINYKRDKIGHWHPVARFELDPTDASARAVSLRRVSVAVNAGDAISNALMSRLEERIGPPGSPDFHNSFTGYGYTRPEPKPRLQRPSGRRLDDDWYAKVADLYRDAVIRGWNPRATIVEAAGVSSDVAGRWVYEARKRGLLAKTKPGKVSA